jgi:hypothetical protein
MSVQCQKLTHAPQQKTSAVARLFDHLVGAREQCRWHLEAKCPCGLQVDDELKLGRAQDRHVGRFLALENAAGITRTPLRAMEIVTRRRKWTPEEKATLLAEVEAKGGRVSVVARRHGISASLLYNWRAAP